MSTEQHERDAYGQELARIGRHQDERVQARLVVFQLLAAVGIGYQEADAVVARLEAGAVAGAHTWVSESSPAAGAEQPFQDGWFAGVRDVGGQLLRIADTTATVGRGRAASHALLLAHLQQPASSAATRSPTPPEAVEAAALNDKDVLAATQRCTWAPAAQPVGRGTQGLSAGRHCY